MSGVGVRAAWTAHRVARLLVRRSRELALRVGLFALLAGLGGASLVVSEGAHALGPRLGTAAHLIVYLDEGIDETRATALHEQLSRTPGVAAAVTISSAQAQARLLAEVERLTERADKAAPSGDEAARARAESAFLPRSIEVRLDLEGDPETRAANLAARLRRLPDVLAVDVATAGIERQATWQGVLRRLALALPLAALALVLVLILGALGRSRRARRDEAELLSLIGATPLGARLPDVLLGAGGALLGATLGLLAAPPLTQVALGLDRLLTLRALGAVEVAVGLAAATGLGALLGALELPSARRLSPALALALVVPLVLGLEQPARGEDAHPALARLDRRVTILQDQRDQAQAQARRESLVAYRLLRKRELEDARDGRGDVAGRQAVRAAVAVATRSQGEATSYAAEVARLRSERVTLEALPPAPQGDPEDAPARLLSPLAGATVVAAPGVAPDPATGAEQRQVGVHLLGRALDVVRAPGAGRVAMVEAAPTGGFVLALAIDAPTRGARTKGVGEAPASGVADGEPIVVIVSGLREVDVAAGARVARGQRVGALGRNLDGAPVLAVEAWRGGVALDPRPLFGLRARDGAVREDRAAKGTRARARRSRS
jgi:cell division protein FtsX